MNELNVVIINQNYEHERDLVPLIFGEDIITYFQDDADMFDLLVYLNIFKSKAEARRNWKRTGGNIPFGYTEFKKIGKFSKSLYIFNPIKTNE
jgi:hypothetical protein